MVVATALVIMLALFVLWFTGAFDLMDDRLPTHQYIPTTTQGTSGR